jgi:hypothetical protein
MLYKYDSDLKEVIFDNEIIAKVPEFRSLLSRKTTHRGDADGRKKILNNKELFYVFLMADWTDKNYLSGVPENDKHLKACKEAEMDDDWKPDVYVTQAIKKYKEIQIKLSPSISTLIAVKKSLIQSNTMYSTLSIQNDRLVNKIQLLTDEFSRLTIGDEKTFNQILIALNQANDILQQNVLRTLDFVAKIEKAIEQVDKLENKVRSETKANRKIVGDRKLGNREMPKDFGVS